MFEATSRYIIIAALTFLFAPASLKAQDNSHDDHLESSTHETSQLAPADEWHNEIHGQTVDEKEFEITELIMHHISDSHEWHFFDWNSHPVSLPLPVIVYTKKNGFSLFSSGRFHHNDDGAVVHESSNGDRFIKVHDKIYLAEEESINNSYAHFSDSHEVTNTTPDADISITKNVFNMFLGAMVMLLLFAGIIRRYKSQVPKGVAKFVEPLVVFVRDDIALQNIGEKHYKRFTPYLLTVFFFIWINNVLGLIPGGANLTGNISFTLTLSLLTFVIVNINGNKDYWRHIFWMPGVPYPVRVLMALIEIVGVFTKPFALMIRLFANMTAGHIVILSLISLVFIFKTIWIAPASVILTLFIYIIKVLVAFLQAYIFALLTALFIGQATQEHDHH